MGRYKTIRANEHCPICGHAGWCAIKDDPELGVLRWCHRYTGGATSVAVVTKTYGKDKVYEDSYSIVNGTDGRMYVIYPTKSTDSGAAFQEYDFWFASVQERLRKFEEENKAYCAQKGYTYRPKSSFSIDGVEKADSGFVYSPPEKVEWKEEECINALSHEVLDRVLREWLRYFVLSPFHRAKLMSEWDVAGKLYVSNVFDPDEEIKKWQIKTLPPEDKVRAEVPEFYKTRTAGPTRAELINALLRICREAGLESPAGIPGIYYNDKAARWDFLSRSGIIFPVIDVNNRMYRFRIGVDTPDVSGEFRGTKGVYRFYRDAWFFERENKPKEEKSVMVWKYGARESLVLLNEKGLPPGKPTAKYVNFSSYSEIRDYENHTIRNRFRLGCQSGSCLSVYRPADEPPVAVWFTEGEKKSIVISAVKKATVVCLPGVNSFGKAFDPVDGHDMSTVESLVSEGAVLAVVAFDADKAENERVQASETALIERLKGAGFRIIAVVDWMEEYGKGIDDTILRGGRVDPRVVYQNMGK